MKPTPPTQMLIDATDLLLENGEITGDDDRYERGKAKLLEYAEWRFHGGDMPIKYDEAKHITGDEAFAALFKLL